MSLTAEQTIEKLFNYFMHDINRDSARFYEEQ